MGSEMQARVAEAMRARREELIAQPLARVWGDLALAAIRAMREPTEGMTTSGGNYVLDVGGIDPMHVDDRGDPWNIKGRETGAAELWIAMLDAEIKKAEEG